MTLIQPELWGRPSPTAVLQRITVVGPYPSEEFFLEIRKKFTPRHVVLVVDDGWSRDEIGKIRELFSNVDIRFASCSGLVHAKLYFLDWRSKASEEPAYVLLWGSANASLAGFDPSRNAEVVSRIVLSARKKQFVSYFNQFLNEEGAIEQPLSVELPGDIQVTLPAFTFYSADEPQSFLGWLQGGILCHKFQPDQTFGRISISLLKPLPRGKLEEVLHGLELFQDSGAKTFRRSYVHGLSVSRVETAPRWRTSYFVETWLGHWTCFDCFSHKKEKFRSKNHRRRQSLVNQVRDSSTAERKKWVDDFLGTLRKAATRIDQAGSRPSDYFEYVGNRFNETHYEKLAKNQVELHRTKAKNKVFCERIVASYVFPRLPSFRNIESSTAWSFDTFVESWSESLLGELRKARVGSLLAKSVAAAAKELYQQPLLSVLDERMETQDDPQEARALKELLEEDWLELAPNICSFWKSEEDYDESSDDEE